MNHFYNLITVTKATNYTLKKLLDYFIAILLLATCLIDWDSTLILWGF